MAAIATLDFNALVYCFCFMDSSFVVAGYTSTNCPIFWVHYTIHYLSS